MMKRIWLKDAPPVALDWLVAKCISDSYAIACLWHKTDKNGERDAYAYSSSWEVAGDLIDEDLITTMYASGTNQYWIAFNHRHGGYWHRGNTPQEAACRAYIHVRMGDQVEVPEELLNASQCK